MRFARRPASTSYVMRAVCASEPTRSYNDAIEAAALANAGSHVTSSTRRPSMKTVRPSRNDSMWARPVLSIVILLALAGNAGDDFDLDEHVRISEFAKRGGAGRERLRHHFHVDGVERIAVF